MAERFNRGELLRIDATFSDVDGAAVDPDEITFSALKGGERIDFVHGTDDEVSRQSTGHYRALIDLDRVGKWWVRVEATGAGQAADERQIEVVSAFPP